VYTNEKYDKGRKIVRFRLLKNKTNTALPLIKGVNWIVLRIGRTIAGEQNITV
jgi:hypothetical protein